MVASASRQAHSGEIPSLNGIRAVSVLIVLLSHGGFDRIVPGGLGVTIFFFLSGYLITTLLLREHARFGEIDIFAFYVRRFLRLMPPLLLTLAVAYSLTAMGFLPGHITLEGLASQLAYFANYLEIFFQGPEKIPAGTGVLWSLAVEEHFYLVFPVLMALAFSIRMSNSRKILIAAGVCAAVLAWRCYLVYGVGVSEARTYFASDTRIDSIVYGCILAFLLARSNGVDSDPARMTLGEDLLLAGGGLLILFTLAYRDPLFRETFRYSLQGIALMPVFHLAVKRYRSWPFRFLNSPLVIRVGIYSYSIYLIHRVIILAAAHNFPALVTRPLLLSSLCLLLSTALAALVHRYVDSYFQRQRAKFHRTSPAAVLAA